MSRHVRAAGGVLWRRVGSTGGVGGDGGEVQVAVVHRPRYDDWSLPKGKLDPDEPAVVGAVREVAEETGFTAYAGRTLGKSHYRVLDQGRDVPKSVRWWAMRAVDGSFTPSAEVDELRWLTPTAALRLVTAGRDAPPLLAFAAHPPETATVLLLRHGSAGVREDWPGADDDRPLDERGRGEALAAAATLPAYGPTRLLTAPLRRCSETVGLLADRLGLPVQAEPRLSERSHAQDPLLIVNLIRGLGSGQDTVVACSQGGAIPDAVGTLTRADGLEPARVTARKGSVWALTFSAGRLVDADYRRKLARPTLVSTTAAP